MAAAVLVFKDSMLEAERLRTAPERNHAQAAAEHKATLNRMADGFESKVGRLVGMLPRSSTELEATAQSMSGTATRATSRPPLLHRRRRRQAPACRRWPRPPRN